jgi:hypothetical protein
MYRNPNVIISKVRLLSLFAIAYNKTVTVATAVKGFMCAGIMPLRKDVVPDERHAPSMLFELHGIPELQCH